MPVPKMYLREASRRAKRPPAPVRKVYSERKFKLTNQVVGHEGHLELIVVLEVHAPQGVLLGVEVLPEPWEGNGAGLLVGVLALPVVHDHAGLGKALERVLSGLGSGLLLLRLSLLGGGGSLLLLLWGNVLEALLTHDGGLNNGLVDGLVDDSLEPSGGGRVLHTPAAVQDELETARGKATSEDISEGDALADEEGVGSQVSLEDVIDGEGALSGLLDSLLVVGVLADERTEPASNGGEELLVGEGHPLEDRSIVLLGLSEEGSLFILRSN